MLSRRFLLFTLSLLTSLLVTTACQTTNPPQASRQPDLAPHEIVQPPDPDWMQFIPPIDCTLGDDCFTLLYVDRDPSDNAQDFACGRQTYDGHNGTDFAIPDQVAMEEGVAVIAAADGQVLRLRDGEPDRRLRTAEDIAEIEEQGRECGNGLVMDHGDGWETQYCHLKQNSLVVEPGQQVAQGETLGLVGLSGKTTFPHVHITVRHQGEVIDPFVGVTDETGCNLERRPLWEDPLGYEPTGVLSAGFAAEDLSLDRFWQGYFNDVSLSEDIPLIYFWVHGYGILEGDVEHFRLLDPEETVITDYETTAERSNLNWYNAVGKRNTDQQPILPGTWRGEYELRRGDEVIVSLEREIQVQAVR
ncbi:MULTISPECIES: M23 family metallopeptidase [Cyanophyceae]|uniref:M23 family metallopeptidase n=1 Tax=Cyanophyceae TaxID=3028117 RepID=UPI001359C384|nr:MULTISPECIES: M23 family metallopeptidase [Cyanophyceae]NMG56988.1 M23 family metallopeptidase [Geitlerinema sp. P-1104]